MNSSLKKYESLLVSGLLVILVIILVFPQFSLPYYWDELGVYARSSLYLHDNGLSLLPAACPPELSRGHPLLFSFIHAVSFSLFGDGHLTGHITSFIISLVLLLLVFTISRKYFGFYGGIASVVFLASQPVFLAQSTLLLPEIALALFMILSIFYWVEKKYLLFVICSSSAILIKETAVLIPVVIVAGNLFSSILDKQKLKIRLQHFLILTPILVFFIFLIIQKQQNGWYLFPLHEDSIAISSNKFFGLLADYCRFVFISQGRFVVTLILVVAIGISILRRRKWQYSPFLVYMVMLMIGGLLFSSINFYMDRYTMFVIVAFSIAIGSVMKQFETAHWYVGRGLILIFMVPLFFRNNNVFEYDVNLGYTTYVRTEQQAIDFTIQNLYKGDSLFANFPVIYGYQDSRFGYCDTSEINFGITKKEAIGNANYFLIADPGAYDHQLPPADSLELVESFSNPVVKMKLWKRRGS